MLFNFETIPLCMLIINSVVHVKKKYPLGFSDLAEVRGSSIYFSE